MTDTNYQTLNLPRTFSCDITGHHTDKTMRRGQVLDTQWGDSFERAAGRFRVCFRYYHRRGDFTRYVFVEVNDAD